MDLYETLRNEKFFNPLTSINKRIYFECICELIEYSKTTPVLYEINVKDTLELYLSNKRYQVLEDEDNDINFDGQDSIRIIRTFRNCGWLSKPELGKNGEYITNITSNCRRIIDFLNRIINRNNDAAISNRILSMYEILQGTFSANSVRKDRPYSSVIVPLMEDKAELKNELLDLKDSISIILMEVSQQKDLTSFGNYFISDQLLERFFNDYFYMKNNGLIPSILKGISDDLRRFKSDEIFKVAIKEYSERMQKSYQESSDLLTSYIDEMLYFITIEYPENMELIDEKINKYYHLANLRIRLITSNGRNLQSSIDALLSKVNKTHNKQDLIDSIKDCLIISSQKYISKKSYQRKKRRVNDKSSIALEITDLTDEEKRMMTNELLDNSINPFSLERTNAYFDNRFKQSLLPVIYSKDIKNKDDALMFASAFIYSGDQEFNYVVEMDQNIESTNIAEITNMVIRRKV